MAEGLRAEITMGVEAWCKECEPGMRVAACLIVKDEAPYLLEWLSFYLVLGFDEIWTCPRYAHMRIDFRLLSRICANVCSTKVRILEC